MRLLVITSNIVVWALVAVLLLTAPPEIPLYYSRIWGESQIATKWALLLLPFLMNMAYYITNWFMHKRFTEEETFAHIARTILFVQSLIVVGILIRTLWILSS